MNLNIPLNLNVLLIKGELEDAWVAVSLERYIVAQGDSPENAIREFTLMLGSEIAYGTEHGDSSQPLAGIPPAPTKYWDKFETAKPYDPPTRKVELIIEQTSPEIRVPAVEQYRLAA